MKLFIQLTARPQPEIIQSIPQSTVPRGESGARACLHWCQTARANCSKRPKRPKTGRAPYCVSNVDERVPYSDKSRPVIVPPRRPAGHTAGLGEGRLQVVVKVVTVVMCGCARRLTVAHRGRRRCQLLLRCAPWSKPNTHPFSTTKKKYPTENLGCVGSSVRVSAGCGRALT